jgi:hypothetical protein
MAYLKNNDGNARRYYLRSAVDQYSGGNLGGAGGGAAALPPSWKMTNFRKF